MLLKPFKHVELLIKNGSHVILLREVFEERKEDFQKLIEPPNNESHSEE